MQPRILQIEDDILAADFSTPDGIRTFEDRARSEYTAKELCYFAYSLADDHSTMSKQSSKCKRSIQWLADEAKALIAQIRGLGAGGIKHPLADVDGAKVPHLAMLWDSDITTGKPIDELYDQTIANLKMIAARAIGRAADNAHDAVINAVAKAHKEYEARNDGDISKYVRRVLDIFSKYFTKDFITFNRADVGRLIHPEDGAMQSIIPTLTKGVLLLPQEERFACFTPLNYLLLAIGQTWRDTKLDTLNVQSRINDIRRMQNAKNNQPPMVDENQLKEECKAKEQLLRDELKNLSTTLLNATTSNANDTKRTLAEIMQGIHAARGDIAVIGSDAHAGRVAAESADRKIKPQRSDAGTKHRTRKTISGAWRSAADVADDFNKAAFEPEPGAPKMGVCNEKKINRWDAEHPDAERKNRWGYYARLRIDGKLKNEYYDALALWAEHWSEYKTAFKKWRIIHKNAPRRDFRFVKMIRTDIDPERFGVGADGKVYVRPMTDNEVAARSKQMKKHGLKPHYGA